MATINLPNNFKLEDNKLYFYQYDEWNLIGIVHDAIVSASVNTHGELILDYDSSLDPIKDAISPIIFAKEKDLDSNLINWNYSEITTTGNDILSIIKSDLNLSYSIFPNTDYNNEINTNTFEEILFTASVNNNEPVEAYDSNQDYLNYINSAQIKLLYTPFGLTITDINIPQAIGYLDMGLLALNLLQSKSLGISNIEGIFITPDGSKLIALSRTGIIYSYDLEENFEVSGASFKKSYTIYSQLATNYTGFAFNYDGTKLYVIADSNKIIQFTLTDAYDIGTLVLEENYFADTNIGEKGIIQNTGEYEYSFDRNGYLNQKQFGTNFEAHTLSSSNIRKALPVYLVTRTFIGYPTYIDFQNGARVIRVGYNGNAYDYRTIFEHYGYYNTFTFSSDGNYLYTVSDLAISDGEIKRYTLSTPWDILSFNVNSFEKIYHSFGQATTEKVEKNYKDNGISDISFSGDGTKMFLLDRHTAAIYQFNLPIAWSLISLSQTTIRPIDKAFDASGYDFKYELTQIPNPTPTDPFLAVNNINSFRFSNNGSTVYIMNDKGYYQYTLLTPYSLESGVLYVDYYPSEYLNSDIKSFDYVDSDSKIFLHTTDKVIQLEVDSNLSTSYYKYTNKIVLVNDVLDIFIDNDSSNGLRISLLKDSGGETSTITSLVLDSTQEIEQYDILNETSYPVNISGVKTFGLSDITNRSFYGKGKLIYEYENVDSGEIPTPFLFETTGSITDIRDIIWKKDGSIFYICGNGRIESYKTKNVFRIKLI